MSGIVINIDPVILRLGGFELSWYGVVIAIAILAALLIAAREGPKRGISSRDILSGALWIILAGLVGAKLFHVIDNFGYYTSNPSQILQPQGLAIWGGLTGGGGAAILYARIKRIPLARAADVVAPALLVALIIGRIACIINGDAYGGVTGLPWGFIYVHPDALIPDHLSGLPTHPYPAYEMLWNLTALLVILKVRGHFRTDGLLFFTFVSLYSVGRFSLTFFRQENEFFGGLQQAQVLALIIFAVSVVMVIYLLRTKAQLEHKNRSLDLAGLRRYFTPNA
jgi:phosphatidylglycerol:prolipoprotein diacylglycerol transferase